MTRKKTTEAVSVSSPKTSASVPVEKKPRAKSVTATSKVKAEMAELVTKPAHKRRKTQEVSPVAAAAVTTPTAGVPAAVVMQYSISQEDIATRAYFYWVERGCPEGTSGEDWFRAESELRGQGVCA